MMSERKSINKSIRLSPRIYEYISSYHGNGFNEQFENIIQDAMFAEAEREKRVEELDEMIKKKYEQYEYMRKQISNLDAFLLTACKVNSSLRDMDSKLRDIVSQI